MRRCIFTVGLILTIAAGALAQDTPSPSDDDRFDPAPPPEIVVPADPELLPPPSRDRVRAEGRIEGRLAPPLKPGTIVSGNVPLYPRVRVEDADEIHPRAVPVIMAVIDPREGPWHPHYKIKQRLAGGDLEDAPVRVVFVKVFLPPRAIEKFKVRREEIDIEAGDWEINIDSEDDVVKIEYDD